MLFWLLSDSRLKPEVRSAIADRRNTIWVSSLSIWECRIKQAKNMLEVPSDLRVEIALDGFLELPFLASHADETFLLPRLHGDPFDRGLLAQARCEELKLVTTDGQLAEYGSPVWFVG